ncbi:uncharacterized protein LOC100180703 [Ciona intestinalis]
MSVIHPGSSINFDGADLQRSEEEEIQREDRKQQQELHELLSAELPDDLLDDDHVSNTSAHGNGSYNISRDSSHSGVWHSGNLDDEKEEKQPITNGNVPYYQHAQYTNHNNYPPPVTNQYQPNFGYDHNFTDAEKWQMMQFHNNARFPNQRNDGVGEYAKFEETSGHGPPSDDYGFAERREAEGSEDFDASSSHLLYEQKLSSTLPSFSPGGRGSTTPGKNVRFDAFSAPTSPYNPYVQYKGSHHHSTESLNRRDSSASKADDSIGSDYVDAKQGFKDIPEHESETSRELTQLRVLYDARGKKLDRMTQELEEMKQESRREKRILNHQLAMAKDQKDGMSGSLEECQVMLQDKDRALIDLEGTNIALIADVEALKSAKTEMVKKLEVSDRTIENLQQEVTMLQRSDALDRARQQHEAVLSAANERHEQQMLEVTSMLDETRQLADLKCEESEQLRLRLRAALKESEDVLLEKSETINRLSRNLEDAQNHCQNLLAGTSETAFLQRQLNETTNEKMTAETKIKALENELADMHEQISMYDNALKLGVSSHQQSSSGMTDSYSELMGGVKRNIDWKTPKIQQFKGQPDQLVTSLRNELERALSTNKVKRDQVLELQKQVKDLGDESNHWREKSDRAEIMLKQKSFQTNSPAPQRQFSNENLETLEEDLRAALERAGEAEERAQDLDNSCREVKQQMCEMIEQHDLNKQEAVDRCERACMQLHEDAKQVIRDEMLADHEQKMYEASVEHEGVMSDLQNELAGLADELAEVKQSYVHVCTEKDQLRERLEHESGQQLHEDKQEIIDDYEDKISEMRAEFEEWEQKKKQEENEWEESTQTKISLQKVAWLEEHNKYREEAVNKAVVEQQKQFDTRIAELNHEYEERTKKLEEGMEDEKRHWDQMKEQEIESRLNQLHEEMKKEEQTAVKAATSIAQLNWITEQKSKADSDQRKRVENALQEARKSWLNEQEKVVTSAVDEALEELKVQLEVLRLERDTRVKEEREVVEREWKKKRDEALKKKEAEMEAALKTIHDQHQREFQNFTTEHKKTLEKFLESERNPTSHPSDQVIDELKQEHDRLVSQHQEELLSLKNIHDKRCEEYQAQIIRLTNDYDKTMKQKVGTTDETSAVVEIKRKHKEDTEKLKSRMKEEYRRWKKERAALVSKLEDANNRVVAPQSTENSSPTVDRRILTDLRQIYVSTLGTIKDEMVSFARDSREHTVNAIKREAQRERRRITTKLRSNKQVTSHPSDESILPSFLADRTQTTIHEPSLISRSTSNPDLPSRPITFQGGVFVPPINQSHFRVLPKVDELPSRDKPREKRRTQPT